MKMKMHGKTIVDGKRKLSTTISAGDLATAVPEDHHHCAIAQSLRRSKGVHAVSVGNSMVYVEREEGVIERYMLDGNERALIKAFDVAGAFPCGYRVTLQPPPVSRKIGARAGTKSGSNKRTGKGSKNALHRATRSLPTRHVSAPA